MFSSAIPYRRLLFTLLLFGYMASVFHAPLFEAIHFCTHLVGTHHHADYDYHTFAAHGQEHHHHSELDGVFELIKDGQKENQQKQQEKEVKKVEITQSILAGLDAIDVDRLKSFFGFSKELSPGFLKKTNPPPRKG